MTDKDIKTICEKIDSLHSKILKSKFAETVTESEVMSLILAVQTINRLKAENERLEKENHCFADIGKMYSEVKAEAIKEFAERLKEYTKLYSYITPRDIDNLVKNGR